MKALTLYQPHASLAVAGLKRNETRSWPTKYRGRLAIHAGRALHPELRMLCNTPIIARALAELGHDTFEELPRGAVLGEVTLVDCLKMGDRYDIQNNPAVKPGTLERAAGIYEEGRWVWVLEDPKPYEKAIPARGALGLWEWPAGAYLNPILPNNPALHPDDCGCSQCERP